MRHHRLERRQRVAASPVDAFEFFSDAFNLEELTPPWLGFRVVTPRPIAMRTGALIDYRLRLHRVPVRWRTRIVAWEPDRCFVDEQLAGPYRLWHHTHDFQPDGRGGTVISDVVRYALPLGPVGALVHLAFVRRDLERIFDFRREVIERVLGSTRAS